MIELKTLGDHSYITKLAGFEHTKYIQFNATHEINDVPLIIGKNIKNGKIIYNFDWYLPKKISTALPRSVLNKRCIVLPYVGNLGDLAIFENEFTCHLGSNVAKIELTDDLFDLDYLYYYLKSNYGQSQLLKDKQGSVQSNITMESIRDTKVAYFEKPKQEKISKVLTTIDSKIELNQRINAELEIMAKTLYDYWFVQFDFPDKNHRPYKTSGGNMIWNDKIKREIPEGWELKKISDLASVTAGGDKPKTYSFDKTETCQIPVYSNGITNEGLYGYTNKATIESQSVTISARGTIGFCVLRNKPFVPIIRLIVITPKILQSAQYFYEYIKSISFNRIGSVQQQLTVPEVSATNILKPELNLVKMYDKFTSPIVSRIETLKEENQKLTELRDWLLPMLMNGQVKVDFKT